MSVTAKSVISPFVILLLALTACKDTKNDDTVNPMNVAEHLSRIAKNESVSEQSMRVPLSEKFESWLIKLLEERACSGGNLQDFIAIYESRKLIGGVRKKFWIRVPRVRRYSR